MTTALGSVSAMTSGHGCPPTRKWALATTAPRISAVSETMSVVERQCAV
jgi:hypothetical protein